MNLRRKYLLLGGSGVLGTELQKTQELYNIQYHAPSSCLLDVEEEDVMGTLSLHKDLLSYDLCGIVHCAAYTDVPGAETPEGRKRAISLNIFGTRNVSFMATVLGIPMIYISTDYVYPGDRGNF
jgi:dTDP-4-dehydrorhamnose reductase